MEIYFIRRAQTSFDLKNIYRKDDDDILTEVGKRQAEKEGVNLMRRHLVKVFSSPCHRTLDTAKIIGGMVGLPVEILDGLRARNVTGVLAGKDMDEALEKDYDLVAKMQNWQESIEGAEDYQEFLKRIKEALKQISSVKGGNVAVITHTSVLSAITRDVLEEGELYNIGECATLKLDCNEESVWKMTDVKKARLLKKGEIAWF